MMGDLPDCIKQIDAWAFRGCSTIEDIHVPNSVTDVGEGAFQESSIKKFAFTIIWIHSKLGFLQIVKI